MRRPDFGEECRLVPLTYTQVDVVPVSGLNIYQECKDEQPNIEVTMTK